jgi:hypothetical protein
MKRILIIAIAIAVLVAGCGSGGSTTKAATQAKTTTARKPPRKHKPKARKHKPKPKKVVKRRVVKQSTTTSSSAAVTTTHAVTATAVTTTTAPPPATTTHRATHTTTHTTTTRNSPAPVTTHQTTTHRSHPKKGGGGHGKYCLSVTDRIATPHGSVPVAAVRPGMSVWSTDSSGRRIAVKVLRVHHRSVPASHMMVRLRMGNGHTVLVSLSHPLATGAAVSTLAAGERYEGARVVSAARVRYGRPYTYDLLPAGSTHTYFANGVLLGSTLAPAGTYTTSYSHLF